MFHGVLAHLSISDKNVSGVRPYVLNFSHFQFLLQNHYMPSHQAYHNCSSIFFRTTTCQATKLTTTVPLSSSEPLHAKPPSLPQLFLYLLQNHYMPSHQAYHNCSSIFFRTTTCQATKLTTTVPLSSSEPLHAKPPSLPQLFLYLLLNHYMPSHQAYHNCSSIFFRTTTCQATKLTTTVPLSSSEPLHAKPPSSPQLFLYLLLNHYMPSHQAYHNCSSIFFRTTTCQATKLTTTVPLSSSEPLHAKPPSLPQLFLYVSLRATKLTTTVPLSSSEPLHAKPPSLPQLFLYVSLRATKLTTTVPLCVLKSHQAYHNCSSIFFRTTTCQATKLTTTVPLCVLKSHQAYHNCSSIFFRTTTCQATKLTTTVPLCVLKSHQAYHNCSSMCP